MNLGDLRAQLLAGVEKARRASPPAPTEHWAIADGYAGIERAQVVVVNVRPRDQHGRAEAMLADLRRLRKDDEVFDDVLAPFGKRTPITAVAAVPLRPPRSGNPQGHHPDQAEHEGRFLATVPTLTPMVRPPRRAW